METARTILTFLGTAGGAAVLLAFVNGMIKWLSGAAGRERTKNTTLEKQRREAIKDREASDDARDEADKRRRIANEYASSLRRQLLENGIQPIDWPEPETNAPPNDETKEKK